MAHSASSRTAIHSLGHLASRQSLTGNGNPIIDFAPNALGQPTRAATYATNATYHPNGALKSFTYGNGIQRTVTLNDRQLPQQVRDTLGTTARYDDSFTYDVNGNPTAITDALGQPGGTRTMAYDALDRLTYANIAGSGVATWSYDVLDNIRTHATTPASGSTWSRAYHYDGSNRLTSITQDGAPWGHYTYDPRGNMIDKTGQTLVFDRASRLTQIPNVANYEYDGHGRRTSQWRADGTVRVSLYTLDGRLQGEADNRAVGSTDYMYLGSTLVAKRFQPWSGSPPVVTYQHSDDLGSPVLETDTNGAVVSRERFLSYGGAVDGAVNDAIGYTGHQEDPASGLVYMQQRYYDPATGRFLGIDPVPTDISTGGNFNRYWYANNNPLKFVDPDGRASLNGLASDGYVPGENGEPVHSESEVWLHRMGDAFNLEDTFTHVAHGNTGLTTESFGEGMRERYLGSNTLTRFRGSGLVEGQRIISLACRFGHSDGKSPCIGSTDRRRKPIRDDRRERMDICPEARRQGYHLGLVRAEWNWHERRIPTVQAGRKRAG